MLTYLNLPFSHADLLALFNLVRVLLFELLLDAFSVLDLHSVETAISSIDDIVWLVSTYCTDQVLHVFLYRWHSINTFRLITFAQTIFYIGITLIEIFTSSAVLLLWR